MDSPVLFRKSRAEALDLATFSTIRRIFQVAFLLLCFSSPMHPDETGVINRFNAELCLSIKTNLSFANALGTSSERHFSSAVVSATNQSTTHDRLGIAEREVGRFASLQDRPTRLLHLVADLLDLLRVVAHFTPLHELLHLASKFNLPLRYLV